MQKKTKRLDAGYTFVLCLRVLPMPETWSAKGWSWLFWCWCISQGKIHQAGAWLRPHGRSKAHKTWEFEILWFNVQVSIMWCKETRPMPQIRRLNPLKDKSVLPIPGGFKSRYNNLRACAVFWDINMTRIPSTNQHKRSAFLDIWPVYSCFC